jgi:hypothetical protein
MERGPTLSSRGAVVVGIALTLAGLGVVWAALHAADASLGAPRSLVVLIGVMFVLGGAATSAALAGWIAFGPGKREFGLTVFLPFITISDAGNEIVGRAAFAVWAGAATLLFVVFAVRGARHIARAVADRAKTATRERSADRVSG